MSDFLDLKNKHILVTGATSGIGRATAVLLSEHGAVVTIVGRREEKLNETLEMMSGENHKAICLDLSDVSAIESLVKEAVSANGPLDGLVQSAGVSKTLPLNLMKYDKLHEVMLLNFYSFHELVRCISRKGRYNEGLSIVGVSSTASQCGVSSQSSYCASKAAMDGAMRSMAKELAPKKIRVNTVLPGPTNTEMYRDYLALRAEVKESDASKPSVDRNYLGVNEAVDVANAIAFLLSSASRMITGVELPVDAGYTSC